MNQYSCEETPQGLLIYCYYEDKKISSLIEKEKIDRVKKTMSLSSDYYLKEIAKKNGIWAIKRAIAKIEDQIIRLDSEKKAEKVKEEFERKRIEQENELREERWKVYQLKKEQQKIAPLKEITDQIELIQSAINSKERKLAELEAIHSQGVCDKNCHEELSAKKKNLNEFREDLMNLIKKKKELEIEINK